MVGTIFVAKRCDCWDGRKSDNFKRKGSSLGLTVQPTPTLRGCPRREWCGKEPAPGPSWSAGSRGPFRPLLIRMELRTRSFSTRSEPAVTSLGCHTARGQAASRTLCSLCLGSKSPAQMDLTILSPNSTALAGMAMAEHGWLQPRNPLKC